MAKTQKVTDAGIVLDPRETPEYYTKSALSSGEWTDAEIRREYSRLRDIAHKRLQRLAVSEPESYAYKHNRGAFPVLRDISTADARNKLPQLARFIAAKTGSVTGIRQQREKAVETLQAHGYDFINKGNIKQFGEFMEAYRADKSLHVVGSPTAADLFGAARERHLNVDAIKEQFGMWLAALPELQAIPPLPDRRRLNKQTGKMETVRASLDDYQREVNRLRKAQGMPALRKKRKGR